jgi:hypothetical protein
MVLFMADITEGGRAGGAGGAGGANGAGGAGAMGGLGAAWTGGASPTPTIVAFIPRAGPGGATAAGLPGDAAGFVTKNECPHFGHRIFSPVGGTRRSSIGYAALHDSHSTFSIRGRAYHRG